MKQSENGIFRMNMTNSHVYPTFIPIDSPTHILSVLQNEEIANLLFTKREREQVK
jgi:hypothetical protein